MNIVIPQEHRVDVLAVGDNSFTEVVADTLAEIANVTAATSPSDAIVFAESLVFPPLFVIIDGGRTGVVELLSCGQYFAERHGSLAVAVIEDPESLRAIPDVKYDLYGGIPRAEMAEGLLELMMRAYEEEEEEAA